MKNECIKKLELRQEFSKGHFGFENYTQLSDQQLQECKATNSPLVRAADEIKSAKFAVYATSERKTVPSLSHRMTSSTNPSSGKHKRTAFKVMNLSLLDLLMLIMIPFGSNYMYVLLSSLNMTSRFRNSVSYRARLQQHGLR